MSKKMSVVIFCNEEKWKAREPVCFGFKTSKNFIPKGCTICGFIQIRDATIHELYEKPDIQPEQEPSWEATIREAKSMLTHGYVTQEILAHTRGLVL